MQAVEIEAPETCTPSQARKFNPKRARERTRRALKRWLDANDDGAFPLAEGGKVKGIVRAVIDQGAVVAIFGGGGACGLLHKTNISWRHVNAVSEVLAVGDVIEVAILRVDTEKWRIYLGMKQLQTDPFEDFSRNHKVGARFPGKVAKVEDFGVFVENRDGVQGLVRKNEFSWKYKDTDWKTRYKVGEDIDTMVLGINHEKRHVFLSIKRCGGNPWQNFAATYRVGDKVKGVVRTINEHGIFVELPGEIQGLVRPANIPGGDAMAYNCNDGREVEVVVLSIDVECERIGLGIEPLPANTDGS